MPIGFVAVRRGKGGPGWERPPSRWRWRRICAGSRTGHGSSTTLLASETVQGTGTDLRGFTWWAAGTQFTTVYPPNSPQPDIVTQNCNHQPQLNLPCQDNAGGWNIQGARSRHPGGVQAVLGDGSVRFVQQSIDLGIWRALSTTHGGEIVADFR